MDSDDRVRSKDDDKDGAYRLGMISLLVREWEREGERHQAVLIAERRVLALRNYA